MSFIHKYLQEFKFSFIQHVYFIFLQVLCALGFYAKGSYQVPTGQSFDIALAQPTVSVILEEITNALNHPQVAGRLIQFPRTRAQQEMCCER